VTEKNVLLQEVLELRQEEEERKAKTTDDNEKREEENKNGGNAIREAAMARAKRKPSDDEEEEEEKRKKRKLSVEGIMEVIIERGKERAIQEARRIELEENRFVFFDEKLRQEKKDGAQGTGRTTKKELKVEPPCRVGHPSQQYAHGFNV